MPSLRELEIGLVYRKVDFAALAHFLCWVMEEMGIGMMDKR